MNGFGLVDVYENVVLRFIKEFVSAGFLSEELVD